MLQNKATRHKALAIASAVTFVQFCIANVLCLHQTRKGTMQRDKPFAVKKDINFNTKMREINPQFRELS